MYHLRRFTVLVVALLMSLSLVPAAAQDEEGIAIDDISQLDGIEDGVARSWSIDFESLMAEATIDPDSTEDPFADLTGVFVLYGSVMKFDSDNHAADAYQQLYDADDSEWTADMSSDAEFEREDIDDLGEEAFAMTAASTTEESEGHYRIIIAQDDEYLFFSMAVSMTDDGNQTADDLADYMLNDGEEDGDDPDFDEDGGSSGGLWGFFPDDDEDFLESVVPAGDEITFPAPDEDE